MVTCSRLIFGSVSREQRQNLWKYFEGEYTNPDRHYDFLLHARWIDGDEDRRLPGVFPSLELWLTNDPFPSVDKAILLVVGPLMTESSAEVVHLAVIEDREAEDGSVQLGLIHAPRRLLPEGLAGYGVNSALLGTVAPGDMSRWVATHPRFESSVRLTFPPHHGTGRLMATYDFMPKVSSTQHLSDPSVRPPVVVDYDPSTTPPPLLLSELAGNHPLPS